MATFFLLCAVVGGTILICQFALTLVGLGGEHGFDIGHDVTHDFSGDSGHATGGAHTSGDDGNGHDAAHQHASSWLFAAISFRTLVAAITFFGLIGSAAQQAQQPLGVQLLLALAAGIGAMYGVHWIIRSIGRLGQDATLRVKSALGQEGTVYVPIDGGKHQAGKIQLNLQNRLVDFEAVTNVSQRLATGTKVRVVGVTGNVLKVEPVGAATVA
jgi:membrane protein implicated in regulation of membrane protease activity